MAQVVEIASNGALGLLQPLCKCRRALVASLVVAIRLEITHLDKLRGSARGNYDILSTYFACTFVLEGTNIPFPPEYFGVESGTGPLAVGMWAGNWTTPHRTSLENLLVGIEAGRLARDFGSLKRVTTLMCRVHELCTAPPV